MYFPPAGLLTAGLPNIYFAEQKHLTVPRSCDKL